MPSNCLPTAFSLTSHFPYAFFSLPLTIVCFLGPSTFSKTAILRGDCKFLPLISGYDYVNNIEKVAAVGQAKDKYIDNAQEKPIEIETNAQLEAVWKTVTVTYEDIEEQCVHADAGNFVQDYWDTYLNFMNKPDVIKREGDDDDEGDGDGDKDEKTKS